MRAIFEIDLPDKCFECDLSWHMITEAGEELYCLPLTALNDENIEADYLGKRDDCPLIPIGEEKNCFECESCAAKKSCELSPFSWDGESELY